MSRTKEKFIYLDNNATTRVCDEATQLMTNWIQSCSNISSSNRLGQAGRTLVDKTIAEVDKLCSLRSAYHVLFTSGASESNCTVIHMVVDAWHKEVGTIPHIVTSSIEHKSILDCVKQLAAANRLEVTVIEPDSRGVIDPEAVGRAIRKTTALVTVMFANNELGSINQIRRIGEIAHQKNVPFHTDAVQIFGKLAINIPLFNIDALSMSFHKLYGPPGVGMLILRKSFVMGYRLQGQISGSQQAGLRGGTENIPGIAGAAAAIIYNFKKRAEKNARLMQLRILLISLLTRVLPLVDYDDFYDFEGKKQRVNCRDPERTGKALCILGSHAKNTFLPSTILMSVIDYDREFCNVRFKKLLETEGVIVSIGSACNTASKNASHVLQAIKAPAIVRRGVLRVSLGDLNTQVDVRNFARIFLQAVSTL